MSDVFSQVYIQTVFAVRNRHALIQPAWEDELYRYITGVVQHRKHKMLAIGGMPDHIHIFFGLNTGQALSDLVREIKKASTYFINKQEFTSAKFTWQAGYGAFSYNKSSLDAVCKYIINQKEHHRKRTFAEEYHKMLADFGIEIGRKKTFDFSVFDDG